MHKTTTMYISESLEGLRELNDQLDASDWIPEEQLISLLAIGGLIIEDLSGRYDPCFFSEDEVEFVTNLADKINVSYIELTSDQNLE